MKHKNWTREELIVAFNLYLKIPFSKINYHHPLIQQLANVLGRSPSAVAWKLANFASLDPTLRERNIKGASNASKLDRIVFEEFYYDWGSLMEESEIAYNSLINKESEKEGLIAKGEYVERIAKVRVNQSLFRDMILASYEYKCCVTGISISKLLVASHIIPWAKDEKNRLNPSNGLCLNAFHDKAFDCGLMTLDEDYRIVFSSEIHNEIANDYIKHFMLDFEGNRIIMPHRFLPNPIFLEYHRNNIFR